MKIARDYAQEYKALLDKVFQCHEDGVRELKVTHDEFRSAAGYQMSLGVTEFEEIYPDIADVMNRLFRRTGRAERERCMLVCGVKVYVACRYCGKPERGPKCKYCGAPIPADG